MRNNFQESLQIQHVACEICNCCTIERLLFHNQYFLYFLHSNISRHCDQKISRPLKNYPHQMIFLLRAIPILHISQNHLLMHVSLKIQVKNSVSYKTVFFIGWYYIDKGTIHLKKMLQNAYIFKQNKLTFRKFSAYINHTNVTFVLSTYLLCVII